jgi:methylated-DNA-[protein]-cysteine S-methyltransferase
MEQGRAAQFSDCAGDPTPSLSVFTEAGQQLAAYFEGRLTTFDLPLSPAGTAFQRLVWERLCQVPFGTTVSYTDLAAMVERPRACRPVGQANAMNPISIVIPCHRVVGANGHLTGYAGGLDNKRTLLAHEAAVVAGNGRS